VTDYILKAQLFKQIVERNDQGYPIKEIKHRKGALITDLDEFEAQRLLKAGAIVEASDEDPEADPDGLGTEGDGDASTPHEPASAAPAASAAGAADPTRPRATATAAKWVAYAKAIGIDEDKVDAVAADKDALIALVAAAEAAN
jgi:hypothetical protein